jgi:transcriptional regulator with XRE-family HTH domain
MSVKTTAQQQYRSIVDSAATTVAGLTTPPEGWLRTVRKALGMSGAELARKMGVTRARVTQAEHAELSGGVTLKSIDWYSTLCSVSPQSVTAQTRTIPGQVLHRHTQGRLRGAGPND